MVDAAVEQDSRWVIRFLVKLVLVVVLVAGFAGAAALVYLDRITLAAIERGASYALGVPTSVDDVSVDLLEGRFGISGLRVANPPGFAGPSFLELGSARLEVDLASVIQDTIHARLFSLDGVRVVLERGRGGSNYAAIMKGLEKFESAEPAEPATEQGESGKRVVIDELRITNIDAELQVAGFVGKPSKVDVAIAEISLSGVGSGGSGVDAAELASIVTKAIFEAIAKAGGVPSKILADLSSGLSDLSDLGRLSVSLPEGLRSVEELTNRLTGSQGGRGLERVRPDDEIGRVIYSILGAGKKSKDR